jgi:hypothetical protein
MGNQGILLKSSADEVPLTAYSALYNAFTDRENTLTIRRGWARIGTTIHDDNAPNGYLKASSGSYRYARSGDNWVRANIAGDYVSIASGLSGNPAITTIANLGVSPYIFLADGTKFLKDYGIGNASPVGLDLPTVSLTAAKASVTGLDYVNIENFSSGIGLWSVSTLAGGGTGSQSQVSGYTDNALRVTASAASTVVRSKKNMDLDLGADDDLTIQIYCKWPTDTDATNVRSFSLKFSLGDTNFTTTYEKTFSSHPMQTAITSNTYPNITLEAARQLMQNNVSFYDSQDKWQKLLQARRDAYQQTNQFAAANVPVGSGVWNQLRVKKSDFIRKGISLATNSALTWANVKAVGIELITNTTGAGSVDIDLIAYRSKGQITGSNMAYTFTYYDSSTDTEGDYADITEVPIPGADGDQFAITFTDTPPSNATHRRLYRMGGLVEQFQLVDEIDISTLSYVDNLPDLSLGDALNVDNQDAPGVPDGVVAYDNRLFIWGVSGEPGNRLRYSKRNKVENFPTDYWIPVGPGSETIQSCVDYDGELYIFTLTNVYRLIGTDENSYRVISTQINIGLVSPFGLARSITALYMASQDGIYEFPSGKRISEAINPLWRGQIVNGISPVDTDLLGSIALAYFNQRIYFSYQENASSDGNDKTLVYDLGYERWHLYGYGVTEFYPEPADTEVEKEAMLLGGVLLGDPSSSQGSYIHVLDYGTVDHQLVGVRGVTWNMTTKELDLGAADSEKQFIDLVVDMDTGNSDVLVQYALDLGSLDTASPSYTTLGTITGNANGRSQYILPFPDTTANSVYGRRIVIKLSGTTSTSATLNSQLKIFKIIPRFLVEPVRHKSFVTDWADEGNASDKIWRELHIEYNSYGAAPTIKLEVDGAEVYSFTGTAVSYRKKFYYSFPVTADMIGTMARIKLDMGSNEIKVYDYAITSIPVANPVTTFETAWSDEGAANIFKRFRKVVVEVDNISGGTITVTPEIDGVQKTPFNITASGRQEYVYSFPADTTGYLWRITVSTTTTMRFYGAKVEALPDPTHGTTYESAWSIEGTANRKRFRDILLDVDTQGQNITLTPWVDGTALTPFTVNTATRQTVILSLPVDTTGILCRITSSSSSFHTIYNHSFTYTEEPHFSTIKETVWTDESWPYDKLWKHVLLDVDTQGQDATVEFWLDGVVSKTWTVNTSSRALLTHSLGQDVIGKLARITVDGVETQLFGAKFAFDQEPPDITVADSYEQTFGYDGWKLLKRIYCAIKAPSTVTIQVYADEVLRDTVTVQSDLTSGYAKVRVDLNAAIKGKLYRFVFTSSESFKLYWEKSQVEMKPQNTNDGWGLYKFNPPQAY